MTNSRSWLRWADVSLRADTLTSVSLPLAGRAAVVTGVSRRRGIGFAVASRLGSMGASLAVHHHLPHDVDEYGAFDDPGELLADGNLRLAPQALGDRATAEVRTPGVTRPTRAMPTSWRTCCGWGGYPRPTSRRRSCGSYASWCGTAGSW